jgi:hypothetical protein
MAFTRSLPELGQIIANQANAIHDTLNAAGVQPPSFAYGATHYAGPYGQAMEDSRVELLEALDELRSLIIGPAGHIFFMSFMGVSGSPSQDGSVTKQQTDDFPSYSRPGQQRFMSCTNLSCQKMCRSMNRYPTVNLLVAVVFRRPRHGDTFALPFLFVSSTNR